MYIYKYVDLPHVITWYLGAQAIVVERERSDEREAAKIESEEATAKVSQ